MAPAHRTGGKTGRHRVQRVICIGTAVVDTVFAVDRLPLAAGKNAARD